MTESIHEGLTEQKWIISISEKSPKQTGKKKPKQIVLWNKRIGTEWTKQSKKQTNKKRAKSTDRLDARVKRWKQSNPLTCLTSNNTKRQQQQQKNTRQTKEITTVRGRQVAVRNNKKDAVLTTGQTWATYGRIERGGAKLVRQTIGCFLLLFVLHGFLLLCVLQDV